ERLGELVEDVAPVVQTRQGIRRGEAGERLDQGLFLLFELVAHAAHRAEDQGEKQGVHKEEEMDGMVAEGIEGGSAGGGAEGQVQHQGDDGNRDYPQEDEPEVDIPANVVGETA